MTNRRPPRLLLASAAALAMMLPLAACGGGSGSGSPEAEPGVVVVNDNYFTPPNISIHAGDTVTWKWSGAADHNVVGPGFSSQILGKGKTFEHTFTEVGDVDYVCTLHQGMKGTVKVAS